MTRHYLVLQTSYINNIHNVMNELIRSPDLLPTIEGVQAIFNKMHLDCWLDDPLVCREPSSLNRELVLHSVLSTVCTYIESAIKRQDMHVVAFAIIVLFLFYRPGLQYRIKADRLEWLKQAALGNDKYPYCHDCFLYLLEQGAFITVVWSKNADLDDLNIESTFGKKRQLSSSQRKRRKELKCMLDELFLKASGRPKDIDQLLSKLSYALFSYSQSKEHVLSQSLLASRSKAWKSGLHLIRPRLCENVGELLDDLLPKMHSNANPQTERPKPKKAKDTITPSSHSSSSSSSSRPSTPFQEAKDMPKIL